MKSLPLTVRETSDGVEDLKFLSESATHRVLDDDTSVLRLHKAASTSWESQVRTVLQEGFHIRQADVPLCVRCRHDYDGQI